MGQYYLIVNPVKKQYLNPHNFGAGLKLMEFLNTEYGPQMALCVLLANGNGNGGGDLGTDGLSDEENALIGSWAGDPVIVAGDYGEPWKFFDRAEYDGKTYVEEEPLYRQGKLVGTMDELQNGSFSPTGKYKKVTHTFGKRKDKSTGEMVDHDENLYSLARSFFEDISDKMIAVIAKGEQGHHPFAAVDLADNGWRQVPSWGVLPEKEPKKPAGGKKVWNTYKKGACMQKARIVNELAHYVSRHPEEAEAVADLVKIKIGEVKKRVAESAARMRE